MTEQEQKKEKEKGRILASFESQQLEQILLKSARNSHCGAIENLFISANPLQGVLTSLQRQFGRLQPGLRVRALALASRPHDSSGRLGQALAIGQTAAHIPRSRGYDPGLPTLRSMQMPTTAGGSRPSLSQDQRPDNQSLQMLKPVPSYAQRKSSFGETIAQLKGMLIRDAAIKRYDCWLQKRNVRTTPARAFKPNKSLYGAEQYITRPPKSLGL